VVLEGNVPVCTGVQRGAGFSNKIKILEESVKPISPHYLAKVRDTEFCDQIVDLGRIRDGNQGNLWQMMARKGTYNIVGGGL
jgi:hypothetical protein